MNLIKAEFRKTLTEAVSYYPDYRFFYLADCNKYRGKYY